MLIKAKIEREIIGIKAITIIKIIIKIKTTPWKIIKIIVIITILDGWKIHIPLNIIEIIKWKNIIIREVTESIINTKLKTKKLNTYFWRTNFCCKTKKLITHRNQQQNANWNLVT